MRIVTAESRDPDLFKKFFQVKDDVRREELGFPAGLGLEEVRVLKLGFRPVAQRTIWELTL